MNRKLDRATLLKGGGTAALALMLAKMTEAKAQACCEPIDLRYFSSGLEYASDVAQAEQYRSRRGSYGIRLRTPLPGESSPPKLAGWSPLFFISDASAYGTDEEGRPHGTDGRKGVPKRLHYGIWVYTKKG